MENNSCIVCGMPLNNPEVIPDGADINKIEWCKYCGTKESIYPYDMLVDNMASFIKNTRCCTNKEALEEAQDSVQSSIAFSEGKIK